MSDEFDELADDLDRRNKVRGRPFVAGQSGNPAGKPKVKGITDIRQLAREYTELALETLVEVMSNSEEKGAARVAAAGVILDRGWGKAQQNIVIEDGNNIERLNDADLADAARKEIAAFIGIDLEGNDEASGKSKLN